MSFERRIELAIVEGMLIVALLDLGVPGDVAAGTPTERAWRRPLRKLANG